MLAALNWLVLSVSLENREVAPGPGRAVNDVDRALAAGRDRVADAIVRLRERRADEDIGDDKIARADARDRLGTRRALRAD